MGVRRKSGVKRGWYFSGLARWPARAPHRSCCGGGSPRQSAPHCGSRPLWPYPQVVSMRRWLLCSLLVGGVAVPTHGRGRACACAVCVPGTPLHLPVRSGSSSPGGSSSSLTVVPCHPATSAPRRACSCGDGSPARTARPDPAEGISCSFTNRAVRREHDGPLEVCECEATTLGSAYQGTLSMCLCCEPNSAHYYCCACLHEFACRVRHEMDGHPTLELLSTPVNRHSCRT